MRSAVREPALLTDHRHPCWTGLGTSNPTRIAQDQRAVTNRVALLVRLKRWAEGLKANHRRDDWIYSQVSAEPPLCVGAELSGWRVSSAWCPLSLSPRAFELYSIMSQASGKALLVVLRRMLLDDCALDATQDAKTASQQEKS